MTVDFVSEVDRRFFANNLLTNEDWDMTQVGMEHFSDLSDILEIDSTLSPEDLSQLPDELLSLDGSCPPLDMPDDTPSLPLENIFDNTNSNISGHTFITNALDDCWKESSDSSDSGIYPENNIHIKQEPPSPVSSNCSDAGSEGYGSGGSTNTFAFTPVKTLTEDVKPTIIINTTSGQHLFPGICAGSNSNINSIINSKIKIQPKPSEVGSSKPLPQKLSPTTNKPLVLTGEEFAKLTAAGALRFQPPGEGKKLANSPNLVGVPHSKPASPPAVFSSQVDGDDKAVRRQQRMIKNRESASLSRKRKKEYLSGLEERLHGFTSENHKLKQENESLKRKLSILQMENEKLKKTFHMSPAKRTCLLAIILVFGFNLGPLTNLLNSQVTSFGSVPSSVNVHRGRHLLMVQDQPDILSYKEEAQSHWNPTGETVLQKLRQLSEEMGWTQSPGNLNQSQFEKLMCPTFFNKTESIRLAEQLAGWMIQHEEEKKKSQVNKPQKRKKEIRPVKTLKKALRGEFSSIHRNEAHASDPGYQVQVFESPDRRKDFLDAIHRRNDTFYVLSFNTDYLLVPASAHNKTMRPRMSLVMPVVGLNETMQPPPGNIGMMQIDCEVISTQLIHVHKSVVPASTPSGNSTHQENRERKWRDRG